MLTFRRITLFELNADRQLLSTLYAIFQSTLNEALSQRAFEAYYFAQHPHAMDITLMLHADKVVGFFSVAFYPSKIGNRKVVISRAAIGIEKEYQGGALPTARLLRKFIRYKCLHPFTPVCIAGFIANPKVYALMCKYAYQVYPKTGRSVPASVQQFKTNLLLSMNLARKELAPFVLKIHFKVALPAMEKERMRESDNKHIRHYLSLNPKLEGDTGVLVLLPVSLTNIMYAGIKYGLSALVSNTRKLLSPTVHPKPVLQALS